MQKSLEFASRKIMHHGKSCIAGKSCLAGIYASREESMPRWKSYIAGIYASREESINFFPCLTEIFSLYNSSKLINLVSCISVIFALNLNLIRLVCEVGLAILEIYLDLNFDLWLRREVCRFCLYDSNTVCYCWIDFEIFQACFTPVHSDGFKNMVRNAYEASIFLEFLHIIVVCFFLFECLWS